MQRPQIITINIVFLALFLVIILTLCLSFFIIAKTDDPQGILLGVKEAIFDNMLVLPVSDLTNSKIAYLLGLFTIPILFSFFQLIALIKGNKKLFKFSSFVIILYYIQNPLMFFSILINYIFFIRNKSVKNYFNDLNKNQDSEKVERVSFF